MKLLLGTLLLLAAPPSARGSDFSAAAVGTTGSEFLTIDAGARGAGMGGAYTAVVGDATSMYWNPAGLTRVPRTSAAYMHHRYVADITFNYLAWARRVSDLSVVGASLRQMDAGDIPGTDISGNSVGSFRPRSYAFEAGYGQMIPDLADFEREVSLGVALRFLRSEMVAEANGYAGDVGIQAYYDNAYFPSRFGAVIQNFGRGQRFDRVRDALPFRARLGASTSPNRRLLVSAEAVFPAADEPHGAVGAEFALEPDRDLKAFLRGGIDSLVLTRGLDGFRGPTLGLGLSMLDFTLDYAFAPMGILGEAHRISIGLNLSPKGSRKPRRR